MNTGCSWRICGRRCEKIVQFSQGLTQAEFLADAKTHDAVMRNLEIIGEAFFIDGTGITLKMIEDSRLGKSTE